MWKGDGEVEGEWDEDTVWGEGEVSSRSRIKSETVWPSGLHSSGAV